MTARFQVSAYTPHDVKGYYDIVFIHDVENAIDLSDAIRAIEEQANYNGITIEFIDIFDSHSGESINMEMR